MCHPLCYRNVPGGVLRHVSHSAVWQQAVPSPVLRLSELCQGMCYGLCLQQVGALLPGLQFVCHCVLCEFVGLVCRSFGVPMVLCTGILLLHLLLAA